MHVEDHPVDYGTFEGVIPEGYGAGIVLLWDRGTWTPEVEDVDAALRKGDLKFTLDGYKLKGSWVLVRTRGDDRSWLLIKHRDDWSGEVDVVESFPMSVKSAGDFQDILASDNPSVWVSNRPTKSGEAGTLLARIIERAAALKAERQADAKPATRPRASRATTRAAAPKARARSTRKAGTKARTKR
jgi:bifunctional non-homologous end joining protein LigD